MSENIGRFNVILELITEIKETTTIKKEALNLETIFKKAQVSYGKILDNKNTDGLNKTKIAAAGIAIELAKNKDNAEKFLQLIQSIEKSKLSGTAIDVQKIENEFTELISSVSLTDDQIKFLATNAQDVGAELGKITGVTFNELVNEIGLITDGFISADKELRALTDLINSGRLSGKELEIAKKRAAELTKNIGDTRKQLKNMSSDTGGLDTIIEATRLTAAGFGIVQGTIALFGEENEDLQKSLTKLTAIMALSNSLQEAHQLLLQNSNIKMRALAYGQAIYNVVVGKSSGALKIFRIALASTGIGLLVLALGVLVANWDKLKKSVTENSDKIFKYAKNITSFMPPLNLVIRGIEWLYKNFNKLDNYIAAAMNSMKSFFLAAGDIVSKIAKGDFSGAYKEFKNIGSNAGKAFRQGFDDATKADEREALIDQLKKSIDNNKLYADRLEALGKSSYATRKKILVDELNVLKLSNADKKEIYEKETELYELETERRKEIQEHAKENRKNALDKEIEDIEKAALKKEIQLKKSIKDEEKLEKEIQKLNLQRDIDIARARQKRLNENSKEWLELQTKLIDDLKKLNQLSLRIEPKLEFAPEIKIASQYKEQIDFVIEQYKKFVDLGRLGLIDPQFAKEAQQVIDILSDLGSAGENAASKRKESMEKITETLINNITKTKKELEKTGQKTFTDKLWEELQQNLAFKLNIPKEGMEAFKKDMSSITQSLSSIYQSSIDALDIEITKIDALIDKQQERYDKAKALAEKGKVDQLNIEEARLRGLQEKREKYIQRQQALANFEIISKSAVALANSIAAVTEGFSTGSIPLGIATAIAIAAQVAAVGLAVKNAFSDIPGYAEGINAYGVSDNGLVAGKGTGKSDSNLAKLSKGERVVPEEVNKKIGYDFPNAKLPEAIQAYRSMPSVMNEMIELKQNKIQIAEFIEELNLFALALGKLDKFGLTLEQYKKLITVGFNISKKDADENAKKQLDDIAEKIKKNIIEPLEKASKGREDKRKVLLASIHGVDDKTSKILANNLINIGDVVLDLYDLEIRKIDELIVNQQERYDKAKQLPEKDKVKQFQIVGDRLGELQAKREKYEKQQRQIASMQIVTAQSVAAAEAIRGLVGSFKKGAAQSFSNKPVEAIHAYRILPSVLNEIRTSEHNSKQIDELKKEMVAVRQSIESIKIVTKLDKDGFIQNIERSFDEAVRRKKIIG